MTTRLPFIVQFACAALQILCAGELLADPQSKSFSHWQFADRDITATFTIPARELRRLPPTQIQTSPGESWRNYLVSHVGVATAQHCTLRASMALPSTADYARSQLTWQCDGTLTRLAIAVDILFAVAPGHVHFANYHLPQGDRLEHLFTAAQPRQTLDLSSPLQASIESRGATLLSYIQFGFEHILIGLDHIAFLLTVLLLGGSWRQLLLVISGFTLGHSVTLSLAALNVVTPDAGFVEALIGFSIALVAVENVTARSGGSPRIAVAIGGALVSLAAINYVAGGPLPTVALLGLGLFSGCYLLLSDSPARALRLRPLLTVGFGLIHGFGFASVLLEVGLPKDSIALALLGFNLGVELGQVVIVAVLIGIGALLARTIPKLQYRMTELLSTALSAPLSAALCALGVYWFCARLFF